MTTVHAHAALSPTRLWVVGLAETAREAADLTSLNLRRLGLAQRDAAREADEDEEGTPNQDALRAALDERNIQIRRAKAKEATPHQSAKKAMSDAIALIREHDPKAPEATPETVASVATSEALGKELRRLETSADLDELDSDINTVVSESAALAAEATEDADGIDDGADDEDASDLDGGSNG